MVEIYIRENEKLVVGILTEHKEGKAYIKMKGGGHYVVDSSSVVNEILEFEALKRMKTKKKRGTENELFN